MTPRPQRFRQGWSPLVFVCCLAVAAVAAEKPEGTPGLPDLPPRPDNAALNYLAAMALMRTAVKPEEIEAIRFIDDIYRKLPPASIEGHDVAIAILKHDLRPGGTAWMVHEGATKPRCAFDVDWEKGPGILLPHLALMRNLTRRCLAAAEYCRYTNNDVRAAEILADVASLGAHLGEDPVLIGGLVGVSVQKTAVDGIEGLLAGEPEAEALKQLHAALAALPPRPFRTEIYFRSEAAIYGDWLLKHPESIRDLVAAPKDLLGKLTAASITARLPAMVREYQDAMLRMAEAATGPYYQSGARLDAEMKALRVRVEASRKDPLTGNSLLPVLLPALERIHGQFALAEAQLGMVRILCAAGLDRARDGAWPPALAALRRHFPEGLPKDPFTGKDFGYALAGGLPRVACEGKIAIPKGRPDLFSLDLGRRRQRDAESAKRTADRNRAQPDYRQEMERLEAKAQRRQDTVDANLVWFDDNGVIVVADTKAKTTRRFDQLFGYERVKVAVVVFGPSRVWIGTDKGLLAWDRKQKFWGRFAVGGVLVEVAVRELQLVGEATLRVLVLDGDNKERRFECDLKALRWKELD